MQLKLIPPENRRDDERQFHLRDIAADASTGPVGEGDEGGFLSAKKN